MSTTERRLHDRILELAAVALDFRLAPAEAADLEGHLAACPTCARTAAALRADTAALRHPASLLPSRRTDDAVAAAIAGRRVRSGPRALVLVAATALLLVALLGAAAVGTFLLQTRPPIVEVPSPPVVVVNPSPSPAPVWQTGTLPPMFTGGLAYPVAIAAGETGFAAVGPRVFRDVDTPAGGTAGAWRSRDGLAWEPATSVAGLAVGDSLDIDDYPDPGLVDVAWGPAGFVAVGIARESVDRVGAAWHSSDGLTWVRTDLPEPARARPAAVTWSGSTYVIVGVVEEETAPRAVAWLSTDGRSWRRVPDAEAFDIGGYITYPSGRGSGGPADVTVTQDGSLVAVGRTCTGTTSMDDTYACRPIVISSSDGEAWRTEPLPDVSGGGISLPSSVAATAKRVVAVSGGAVEGDPSVFIRDDAGWRVVDPAGVPTFARIVAFGDRFVALATTATAISLWTSSDGEAWAPVSGMPQPPDVTSLHEVDLVAAGTQVVIVGSAEVGSTEGWSSFAIAWSPRQAEPATPTPSPSVQPAPAWVPAPGALPVASGTVQLAAGPDGGTYVVVSSARDGAAVQRDRSVLALLDPSGEPRTGWPVAADGWACASPDGSAWPPEVAGDGSVTVLCRSGETPDGSVRTSASRFDAAGRLLASWSHDGESSGRPRVVDGRLLVIADEVTEEQVTGDSGQAETRYTAAYWLDEVAADGTRRSGVRLDVGEAGWPVVLGPDGTAYHVDMEQGVITAFDLDGRLAGWPARLDGSLSALGFGPDGRVYVTVAPAAAGASSLVVLARDGSTVARSDTLPLDGTIAYSGAGPGGRPMAPLVADDGTAFVIGEAADHTVVYAIDPSGAVKSGWPYRADTAVQWQGTCPAETAGCGVWRASPAVGPDGIVYLPLAAPDAQVGGSVAAIGPDGRAIAGWPMHLARRGAEFWAAVAGSGDTAWAVAVEPEAGGGSSATVLAFAADGAVRSRTTVVDPKAGS